MSSTNKTSNYELSQFLGTDKPAWLSDYNTDMSKIDAQMKLNADGVTAAAGSASSANTAIGTLGSLTTDDKTSIVAAINEVDSHADTAQNTANSANTTAGAAKNEADALAAYLTLTGHQNLSVTTSQGTITTGSNIASAANSDGSLGKIYGNIILDFSGAPSGTVTITIADTSLRPSADININALAYASVYTSSGLNYTAAVSCTINTDGTVTITQTPSSAVTRMTFAITPSLLFMSNFGD